MTDHIIPARTDPEANEDGTAPTAIAVVGHPGKLTATERHHLLNGVMIGLAWARNKALADMADHGGRPASDFAERLCRDQHQSEYIAGQSPLYRGRV